MNKFPFQYFEDVSLSIVVPVYNEGVAIKENLGFLLDEVGRYFKRYDIIVVSDGSTDETNSLISSLKDPHFKPVILEKNQGKGAAVRHGLKEAKGDFVLFIDGGMELHPREIKIFLGLMYLYNADMVIGSKRHPQSNVFYPWYRRFLSFLFQCFVRVLFKINVTDTQVGIKMFRGDVIRSVLPYMMINSYGFDLEILGLAARLGHRNILEAPVRLDYFLRQKRPLFPDLLHTAKIGLSLLKDTFSLWVRLRKISKRSR